MNSPDRSTEPILPPDHDALETQSESSVGRSPSPVPHHGTPTINDGKLITKLIMIWPIVIHFLGSVAVAATILSTLDGHQFFLERNPRIKLADGTYESQYLGRNHLLQSDVTTILSVALMVLRWIASSWAVSLCWRVIFLLAGRTGLRRRDIEWVVNYSILPPATHFQRPLNLILGLILILTLAPYPGSPLLTGSISWVPSSLLVDLPYHPILNLTAEPDERTFSPVHDSFAATFSTILVKNFNTAWNQEVDEQIFKRVVPFAAQLGINSTIDNVTIPYFVVTNIQWLPKPKANDFQLLQAMRWLPNSKYHGNFEKMGQPGATAIIVDPIPFNDMRNPDPIAFPVLINVGKPWHYEPPRWECNSTTTFLPDSTTIPYSFINFDDFTNTSGILRGCFARASVSFYAGSGHCIDCRVGSYSTVQNDTELGWRRDESTRRYSLRGIPQDILDMTPLEGSLPPLANGVEEYLTALLTRAYSAAWNTRTDNVRYRLGVTSRYRPAIPTLMADVNHARVYAWLTLQLLFTFAGLAFLWLQSRSRYPLITDTDMVAFDIDSTEAPKPKALSKHELDELLQIEPQEDGWKVVIASGRGLK